MIFFWITLKELGTTIITFYITNLQKAKPSQLRRVIEVKPSRTDVRPIASSKIFSMPTLELSNLA